MSGHLLDEPIRGGDNGLLLCDHVRARSDTPDALANDSSTLTDGIAASIEARTVRSTVVGSRSAALAGWVATDLFNRPVMALGAILYLLFCCLPLSRINEKLRGIINVSSRWGVALKPDRAR